MVFLKNTSLMQSFCEYWYIFSRESDSRIANVRLSVRLSVCPSVSHKNLSGLRYVVYLISDLSDLRSLRFLISQISEISDLSDL